MPAISQGLGQVGEQLGPLQHRPAVHRHLQGLIAEMVAARRHQPQLQLQRSAAEIGAGPGHTSHVAGPGGLHQHHGDAGVEGGVHTSELRKLSRSAIAWGSGWKLGIGGVRPLTTC